MQDIKFRAWSNWDNGGEMDYFTINEPKVIENIHHNAKIMQYTGLFDKNNQEIYTGDILDCSYTNPMTGDVVKKLYLVESTMGYIKTQRIGGHPYDNFPLFLRENRGVIIGNIYENPELLEVE